MKEEKKQTLEKIETLKAEYTKFVEANNAKTTEFENYVANVNKAVNARPTAMNQSLTVNFDIFK